MGALHGPRTQADSPSLNACSQVMALQHRKVGAAGVRIVAGNTGPGVYKDWPHEPVLVSIAQVGGWRVAWVHGHT